MIFVRGLLDPYRPYRERFFLWGYVKDRVFIPPLRTHIDDLRNRISAAVRTIDTDMLRSVWDELPFRVGVAHASDGAQIEHL